MEIYEIIRLVCEIIVIILSIVLVLLNQKNKSCAKQTKEELEANSDRLKKIQAIESIKKSVSIFMGQIENISNIDNKQRKDMTINYAKKIAIELGLSEEFINSHEADIDNFIEHVINIKNKFKKV